MRLTTRRGPAATRVAMLALAFAAVCGSRAAVAGRATDEDAVRALRAVAELRTRIDPEVAPTEDSCLALTWRGRPSLEIKGRTIGGSSAGQLRDETIFDLAAGRIVSFVWFPHASARKAGEPIISLSEVSSRADAHVRRILPGADLPLESVERYRVSGQESVYYQASFAAPSAEIAFLQPPVRLLLDASTGDLFRFDVDAEWFAPPPPPAARLSRKAAERVAAALLRSRDLAAALGPGAALGKIAAADLYVVRPNDWLGSPGGKPVPQASVAWVVPFSLAGDASGAVHRLFVDAATGRLLGGLPAAR